MPTPTTNSVQRQTVRSRQNVRSLKLHLYAYRRRHLFAALSQPAIYITTYIIPVTPQSTKGDVVFWGNVRSENFQVNCDAAEKWSEDQCKIMQYKPIWVT